jgi:hypothetical protein
MKSAVGDGVSGLPSKMRTCSSKISDALAETMREASELYFAKSGKHLIDATDAGRFEAREVTIIYLSFTNVRISIALAGGGVSLEGGANRTHSGR